jgi:hypothetical protein
MPGMMTSFPSRDKASCAEDLPIGILGQINSEMLISMACLAREFEGAERSPFFLAKNQMQIGFLDINFDRNHAFIKQIDWSEEKVFWHLAISTLETNH